MFNRYWREYPWFLQLVLFGLMTFVFISFFFAFAYYTVPMITGNSITEALNVSKQSSPQKLSVFIWLQGASSIFSFILPAILFANQTHPDKAEYLGLKKPQRPVQLLWSILLMLGAFPIFIEIAALLKEMKALGDNTQGAKQIEEATEAILNMNGTGELLRALLVMAVIPALGEELFFRGVLMRLLHLQSKRIGLAVIVTAAMFAAIHGTPYNFLSIFIAGIFLCIIYIQTGSLWCSIAAHCVYNGSQVLMSYWGKSDPTLKALSDAKHLPIAVTLIGTAVFALSAYMLWKNRTPLPADWSDNFRNEEPEVSNSESI
jgi:uncharacterized protein